jgi:hypothetical protein
MVEQGGMHLSSWLCEEAQIGGSQSKSVRHKERTYLKKNENKKGWQE